MASINLQQNHKEDLKFLQQLSPQVLTDFCKLSWNYLQNGPNIKLYQVASQKLGSSVKQIQSSVEALTFLFIEIGKSQLSEQLVRETVLSLGFSEELFLVLHQEYSQEKKTLTKALPFLGVKHMLYKNLEWRFQTQVSSRSIDNEMKPRVILKLELDKCGERETISLESDIPNVLNMNRVLNEALMEAKTQHSRKIQRAVS